MPKYIQRDLNDPQKFKIEDRSKADENTVCPAPEGEEIEWLDIINEVDPVTGTSSKRAIVNGERKRQILQERQTKKNARRDEDAKREARILRLRQAYKNMDSIVANPNKLANLLKGMLIDIAKLTEEGESDG